MARRHRRQQRAPRPGLLVHRVAEPRPTDRERVTTEAPTSFRLRYADGPRDAEALLVHPRTGRLYVVTKPLSGGARVYAAPEQLDPDGPNALTLVAEVELEQTGTAGGPGIGSLAQRLSPPATSPPDGRRVALRTYTDVYEWPVEGTTWRAPSRVTPSHPLPETSRGKASPTPPTAPPCSPAPRGSGRPCTASSGRRRRPPSPSARSAAAWPYAVAGGVLALLLVVRGAARHRRYTRR